MDWREQLSKKCPWLYKGTKFNIVVSFIENLLANQEKEIAEEVEKKNEKLPYTPDCTGEQIIYNENHMSLIKHAERELRLAGFFDKDSDYEGALGKAVMELIEVFS